MSEWFGATVKATAVSNPKGRTATQNDGNDYHLGNTRSQISFRHCCHAMKNTLPTYDSILSPHVSVLYSSSRLQVLQGAWRIAQH